MLVVRKREQLMFRQQCPSIAEYYLGQIIDLYMQEDRMHQSVSLDKANNKFWTRKANDRTRPTIVTNLVVWLDPSWTNHLDTDDHIAKTNFPDSSPHIGQMRVSQGL